MKKSSLVFLKKYPDCFHLWVKCLIWNVVLISSKKKNTMSFPCRTCVVDKIFINMTLYQKSCLPWKIRGFTPESLVFKYHICWMLLLFFWRFKLLYLKAVKASQYSIYYVKFSGHISNKCKFKIEVMLAPFAKKVQNREKRLIFL